jgi:ATP-binding cassette, subfamily C, bacterial CydC
MMRRLFDLARPFWRGMLFSGLLSVITVGTSVGMLATSAWLISKAGLQVSIADLGVAPVMVRFFGISRGVFRYLERLVSHDITFRLLARLRVYFYTAIEPLAPARLAQYRSGDLLGRLVGDVEELENIFLRVISPPLVALITAALMTVFFLGFDLLLALIVLACMVATGTLLPLLAWWQGQGPGRDMVRTRSELNAALVDTIQGMADTVAYGHQLARMEAMDALNNRLAQKERRMALYDGLQTGTMTFAIHITALLVLVAAVPRVDPIFLATLSLAVVAAYEAIMPLVPAAHHLGASLEAAERLFALTDADPAVRDPESPAPRPDNVHLTVDNLTFRYADDEPPALDGVSFELPPGKMLAVVGPSGAGKTTLTNVLLRFWEYDSGSITLGGRELRELAQDDVHALTGVMSQRTHLFNTTLVENIRLAHNDASIADIEAAARRAQIHDFIASLPDGYETDAGESGANLSGGERQRIALARVLLKNAPLVILDEATANLDAVTEREVMEAIYASLAGRSLLMITHRLTLLDRADEIIVLDGGQVVQRGTHAQLVAENGLYRRLWESQSRLVSPIIEA